MVLKYITMRHKKITGFSFIATLFLLCEQWIMYIHSADTRLKCKPEWQATNLGNAVPINAILGQGNGDGEVKQFVVRATINSQRSIGRFEPNSDRSYFPVADENHNVTMLQEFEILINPSGCTTVWTTIDAGFRVPSAEGDSNNFIGRTQLNNAGQWYPGHVIQSTLRVATDDEGGIKEFTSGFQYLISYSKGLSLVLHDFEFVEDMDSNTPDFLNVDEIQNESPALVSQSVTHTKNIREVSQVVFSQTFVSTQTSSVGFNAIFYGKKKSQSDTYSRTETTTITTETHTNISVSLEFSVEPYSSVRACSVLHLKDNFESAYSAIGTYSAPGLNPEDIMQILRQDNIPGVYIQDDEVLLRVEGTIKASVALSSQFIVDNIDSNDKCMQMKRLIARNKKIKRNAGKTLHM